LLDVFGTVFKNLKDIKHWGDVVEDLKIILKWILGK
jgi:hypothetical protein